MINYNNKNKLINVDLYKKVVFVRCDFNVPISDEVIHDDTRIIRTLDTIKYLIENNAKIVIMSHLGRINDKSDIKDKNNSLYLIAIRLSELLDKEVIFIKNSIGKEVEFAISKLIPGGIIMLENTRFNDVVDVKKILNIKPEKNEENITRYESDCSPLLSKYWASLCEVFVNDAFGATHRKAASTSGLAKYCDISCVGLLVENELKIIYSSIQHAEKPILGIIGGAKVNDKLLILKNLITKCDNLIICGGMAFTFLFAKGYTIGKSLFEPDRVEDVKEMIKKYGDKIHLPVDFMCNEKFDNDKAIYLDNNNIPDKYMALDAGKKSIIKFTKWISKAKAIIWNGPLGVCEFSKYKNGTRRVAEAIGKSDAISIVGGGDSIAAIKELKLIDNFTHISTGGGAFLVYLENNKLEGIEPVQNIYHDKLNIDFNVLLDIQKNLDSLIIKHNKNQASRNIFEKKLISLIVELSEFYNEVKFFKYWSKSYIINRYNVVEEYIDCLHFYLSLFNDYKKNINIIKKINDEVIDVKDINSKTFLDIIFYINTFYKTKNINDLLKSFNLFLTVRKIWSISSFEIIKFYIYKRNKNEDRQKNNY